MGDTPLPKTNIRRERLFNLAVIAMVALSVAAVFYYVLIGARTTFYADCSDTLYWAMASFESGAIFSRDFVYATLQPFGGMLLMLPFIPLFGFSLTTHLIGMALFAVIFMLALWFFCSALDISLRQKGLLFSGLLLLISSSAKLRELMWEHVIYYSLGILFSMLFFGLCFRLQKLMASPKPQQKKLKNRLYLGLLGVLSLLVATDGMQVLLLCTFPVVAALIAERFFDNSTPLTDQRNRPALIMASLMVVATLGGLALLSLLSRGIHTNYTEIHMLFSPTTQWPENIMKLPAYWSTLVGFSARPEESIVSLPAVVELLRLVLATLLVVVPVVAAIDYKQIKNRQLHLLLWYHGALSAVLLLSHIVGSTANANWRFMPAVFSSLVVTLLYMIERWKLPSARRLTALVAAVIIALSAVNLRTMLTTPARNGQNQIFYSLVAQLEASGLSYGYADFQVSQPLTVLSSNRVKTRYVMIDENGIAPFYYQGDRDWYGEQPGADRYFVVVTLEQYEALASSEQWPQLEETMVEQVTVQGYYILIFSESPVKP